VLRNARPSANEHGGRGSDANAPFDGFNSPKIVSLLSPKLDGGRNSPRFQISAEVSGRLVYSLNTSELVLKTPFQHF